MEPRFGIDDVRPLLDRLMRILLTELSSRLVAVALFGSVARGEATTSSDIDLYVVHKGPRRIVEDAFLNTVLDLRTSREYQILVRGKAPREAFPVFCSLVGLDDTPWLLIDVAADGTVLYDPDEVLTRRLDAVRARLDELGSVRVGRPDGSWYWRLKPDLKPGEVFSL